MPNRAHLRHQRLQQAIAYALHGWASRRWLCGSRLAAVNGRPGALHCTALNNDCTSPSLQLAAPADAMRLYPYHWQTISAWKTASARTAQNALLCLQPPPDSAWITVDQAKPLPTNGDLAEANRRLICAIAAMTLLCSIPQPAASPLKHGLHTRKGARALQCVQLQGGPMHGSYVVPAHCESPAELGATMEQLAGIDCPAEQEQSEVLFAPC